MRSEVKQWRGHRTDDDLDRMEGEWDKWIGRLQERYGDTREHAESAVDRRLREYDCVAR
jgi:uncharacterized protein YjbJ (UPF0337 family)